VQPLADQTQQDAVLHPLAKHGPELAMVEGVEEAVEVQLQHPAALHRHGPLPEILQRLVRGAAGPKPIRAGEKRLLVDRLEHHADGALEDLVLEGRNPNRAGLLAARPFRDVHPSDRRRSVASRLHAVQQGVEVPLQVDGVLVCGLVIDADGPVLAGAPVGLPQEVHVDVVREGAERGSDDLPRQCRYPVEFR